MPSITCQCLGALATGLALGHCLHVSVLLGFISALQSRELWG